MKQPTIKVGGKEYPQQWFSWAEVCVMINALEGTLSEKVSRILILEKEVSDAGWRREVEALEFVDRSCGWK